MNDPIGGHVWRRVATNTTRLRVPGGWIYAVEQTVGEFHEGAIGFALVFVPDPDDGSRVEADERRATERER